MTESLTEKLEKLRHTNPLALRKKKHASRQEVQELNVRWDALNLRRDGYGYQEIADQLGISTKSAHEFVEWALEQVISEPAEELRELELSRLDTMQRGIWDKAKDGEYEAIDRVLKIMDRRAKLTGLDKPAQIDMNFIMAEAIEIADQLGLDPMEIIRHAESLVKGAWSAAESFALISEPDTPEIPDSSP